jgi:ABC-type polysaccharide/polyol phosphate export permease
MVVIALYIFSSVNFPVAMLPNSLQLISYNLPLTRGIQAARLVMDGATWPTISSLFIGELFVGLIYISVGYFVFTWFEKLSLANGQIETM